MISNSVIDDAVAEALQLDLCFLSGPGQSRHVPFAFTPAPVGRSHVQLLEHLASLLGRLTQTLASDTDLIQGLHAPLAQSDPFFAELLSIHRELHMSSEGLPRLPLLLQRSDFMLEPERGPSLVECNSIAAGMAPFGDRAQQLHRYLQERWPNEFARYSSDATGSIVPNPATDNLAAAITAAAQYIRLEAGDGGTPTFLMVVQENEDNIFDQRLLERALQARGVATFRRTFRQLHAQLSTGPNQRLLLEACGALDVVYLRAGYQHQDYVATDLDTASCCDALRATRVLIERHRVAVNATIAQQLATSKRTQQYVASNPTSCLAGLGFLPDEVQSLGAVFAEMRAVDSKTAGRLRADGNLADWVLKNQGEGGGHCLFDQELLRRLDALTEKDYAAWTLMRRLRPAGREVTTLAVREGKARHIDGLVSEIGLFTAHLEDKPLLQSGEHSPGYVGYLVRSKPPEVTEGGVHSGLGMLDSLILA